MNVSKLRSSLAASLAVSVLLLTAACGASEEEAVAETPPSAASSASPDTATDAPNEDNSTEDTTTGAYVAGTYDAEGSYQTPGGTQSVAVEVTLDADGTITDVTVEPEAGDGNSLQFQTQFAEGIADEVVGVNIDDLDVSKVSGSSLTSGGFNAAIETIVADALA